MHGLKIAAPEDHTWHTSIKRHFDMNLTPFSEEFRTFKISFEPEQDIGYVCRLRARRRSGRDLAVTVHHNDGEAAIAFAFARARRELQRSCQIGRR